MDNSFALLLVCLLVAAPCWSAENEGSFFEQSLHRTSRGMAYWYAKERGGCEKMTGIPYDELGCKKCHVRSCDDCHAKKVGDTSVFLVKQAHNSAVCLKCHGRAKKLMALDSGSGNLDVHFKAGMGCSQCHGAHDVHGDGKVYDSLNSPGAMKAACEDCHSPLPTNTSHAMHSQKLHCSACHVRHALTCFNCHFSTMVKERKKLSRPVTGWQFLINHRGKVTAANLQSVVHEKRTFVAFAPAHTHSVMPKGRSCGACHDNEAVKVLNRGETLPVTWFEGTEFKTRTGVIPIVKDQMGFAFLDYRNGAWEPLKGGEKPIVQFAGFGTPLTKEQLGKMAIPIGP